MFIVRLFVRSLIRSNVSFIVFSKIETFSFVPFFVYMFTLYEPKCDTLIRIDDDSVMHRQNTNDYRKILLAHKYVDTLTYTYSVYT